MRRFTGIARTLSVPRIESSARPSCVRDRCAVAQRAATRRSSTVPRQQRAVPGAARVDVAFYDPDEARWERQASMGVRNARAARPSSPSWATSARPFERTDSDRCRLDVTVSVCAEADCRISRPDWWRGPRDRAVVTPATSSPIDGAGERLRVPVEHAHGERHDRPGRCSDRSAEQMGQVDSSCLAHRTSFPGASAI